VAVDVDVVGDYSRRSRSAGESSFLVQRLLLFPFLEPFFSSEIGDEYLSWIERMAGYSC